MTNFCLYFKTHRAEVKDINISQMCQKHLSERWRLFWEITWLCRSKPHSRWCRSGPFSFGRSQTSPELWRPPSELWRHARVEADIATGNPAEGSQRIGSAACQDQRGSREPESRWKKVKIVKKKLVWFRDRFDFLSNDLLHSGKLSVFNWTKYFHNN